MAARLSPEEREQRRKERSRLSFSNAAYQHYDPKTEGYGSAEEWIAAAEALVAGYGTFKRAPGVKSETARNPNMIIMGLLDMPSDIDGLKKAFRNAAKIHHPDVGGSTKAMQELLAAFEKLSKFYS